MRPACRESLAELAGHGLGLDLEGADITRGIFAEWHYPLALPNRGYKSLIVKWLPETGLASRVAFRICNLQILKDTESAKSARMLKTVLQISCKIYLGFSPWGRECLRRL